MPVYEDWNSALELCRQIDVVMQRYPHTFVSVLFIDDGSQECTYPAELPFRPSALDRVSVLALRRNLGHQRAIAIGLAWINERSATDAVVVMDADGEDRAEDVPRLIESLRDDEGTAVLAQRGKRIESATFRLLYQCYRGLHRFLVGRDIHFGNFSALPSSALDAIVAFPELWNHYAATLIKSRLRYRTVLIDRGRRIDGASRMSFASLVIHGLSALFANQEIVVVRLLVMLVAVCVLLFLAVCAVVGVRLATDAAIPGWATSSLGILLILVGQALIAAVIMVFATMMNRSNLGFLPLRDYHYFVRREVTLFDR
jgi:glycosyltransferase involved in cell wall biosynthesis